MNQFSSGSFGHRVAGFYKIPGGFSFALANRPNWFNRLMVRLLLGWRWEDA